MWLFSKKIGLLWAFIAYSALLMAQEDYVDRSFTFFDFQPPSSAKAWRKRQKDIRNTAEKLFGKRPPIPKNVSIELLSREERTGYVLESFRFFNGVDAFVTGYLLIPTGLRQPAPAILYQHYHGGDYKQGKEELFKPNYVNTEGPGPELARKGYVVMAVDAYAFGARSGKGPNGAKEVGQNEELTWQKNNLWKGRCLWGMIVRDDQMALNYLLSRPEVDAKRVASMGLSMGCLRAFWLAALDERIKVTVAVSCLVRNQELFRNKRLNGHGIYYYVPDILNHFDNESILACIAPRPLLTLAGAKDPISPIAGAQYINAAVAKVYACLEAEAQFKSIIYPDFGHEFNPTMWTEALIFLENKL